MRPLVAAALLATTLAVAQDDPFLKGDELKAAMERKCADGCVMFSREDAAAFEGQMEKILSRIRAEAFAEGVQSQKAACRSLI